MKLKILFLVVLFSLGLNAQEYNKWSVDVNAGVNVVGGNMSDGYFTKFPNFFSVNGGVRYMFNNKFGLRLGGGYDTFKSTGNSYDFDSKLWNANLQGVINFGRTLGFEEWTNRVGLLGHFGIGYGRLTSNNFRGVDELVVLNFGFTPQVRLSNRVTLLFTGNFYKYMHEHYTFNGEVLEKNPNARPMSHTNFNGLNFTATAGLQIALGGKKIHADWYTGETLSKKEREDKIAQNEEVKDNVLSRGGSGLEENGIRGEELERLADNNANSNVTNHNYNSSYMENGNVAEKDPARELIEKGYVNAYFGFDSSTPQDGSLWAVGFVANYLNQNPDAKVKIIGYTDSVGNEHYNQRLSRKRAESVREMLIEMGVDESRLSYEGKGIDRSNNATSANARKLVRRVTFELKDSVSDSNMALK